jgi:hypothetical protein
MMGEFSGKLVKSLLTLVVLVRHFVINLTFGTIYDISFGVNKEARLISLFLTSEY